MADNFFKQFFPAQFEEFKSSILGRFIAAAPIITGIALAGSVIPFFLTTQNTYLAILGITPVLVPLVIFSAVAWAIIYGSSVEKIQADFFASSKRAKWSDKNADVSDLYNQIQEYNDANTIINNLLESNDIKTIEVKVSKLLNVLGKGEKKVGKSIRSTLDDILTKLKARTQAAEENNIIDISKKITYAISNIFNYIGIVNAFLVNSAGVAISGLSMLAFFTDLLFKLQIISSPIIPMPVAITVCGICFYAGTMCAYALTRVKTQKVAENITNSVLLWWQSNDKFAFMRDIKNISTIVAIFISIIVGVGFAGFNYYTGLYFGSMLVECLFKGNFTNLTDPKYILDAQSSNTTLGLFLGLLGFSLTIISTSSFLYETQEKWSRYIQEQITSFFMPVNNSSQGSNTNTQEWLIKMAYVSAKVVAVTVMALATAAMLAIGTSKIGSFWSNFLPVFMATAQLLQLYGYIVFAAALPAFYAVFYDAATEAETIFTATAPTTKPYNSPSCCNNIESALGKEQEIETILNPQTATAML